MQHQKEEKNSLNIHSEEEKSASDKPVQSTALKRTPFQLAFSKLTPEEIDCLPSFLNWPTHCTKEQQAVINKLMNPVEKKTIAKEEASCKI